MSNLANKALLSLSDFRQAALSLGLREVAPIQAVAFVEAAGKAFYEDGRTPILFEAHIFGKLTGYKFNSSHPHLSTKKWTRRLYLGGPAEYKRLKEASELDARAALLACSWGMFQILGTNYRLCGFDKVEDFVAAMQASARAQLMAFCHYVVNRRLNDELARHDWASFARAYNGPSYYKNAYDKKMAAAYKRCATLEKLAPPQGPVTPALARVLPGQPQVEDEHVADLLVESRWYLNDAQAAAQVTTPKPALPQPAKSVAKHGATALLAAILTALSRAGDWLAVHWLPVALVAAVLAGLLWWWMNSYAKRKVFGI